MTDHIDATGRPEEDARRVLKLAWRTNARGRPSIPVDPVRIALAMGVQVFNADIETDIAGMLVKKPGTDPAIYLNRFDSQTRQRFTCAHELGHYVKRTRFGDAWEYIDRRSQVSARGTNTEEIYANQFAAALLMPAARVQDLSDTHEPFELSILFGVSQEAMNLRLRNLGLR